MASDGDGPALYDVLVVGGGPAGLTAAVTFARQQHTVMVLDSGSYRNAASKHLHNVPTWDHRDPAEFRAAARKDALENYATNRYTAAAEVVSAKKIEDPTGGSGAGAFELADAAGRTWRGRKLVLATGVADDYPDVPGYAEVWGRGIYHCLFCHGYEERGGKGTSAGVLAVQLCASPPHAAHMARNAAQLVPEVTVYTDGDADLAAKIQAIFDEGRPAAAAGATTAASFAVDSRKILKVAPGTKAADVVLHFADGSTRTEAFVAHNPKTHARGPLPQQLGLELTPSGDIKVSPPFQQTSLPGVFAAGDCQTPFKVTPNAIASGSMVAAGVSAQLQAEMHGQKGLF